MNGMKDAFQRFMAGRYGSHGLDHFGLFQLIAALVFTNVPYVWPIGFGIAGWAVFRLLSRNATARLSEEQKYRLVQGKATGWLAPAGRSLARSTAWTVGWGYRTFRSIRSTWDAGRTRIRERKTHVFVTCSKCRKTLRLPRGKGRLQVTCPVCGTVFEQRT